MNGKVFVMKKIQNTGHHYFLHLKFHFDTIVHDENKIEYTVKLQLLGLLSSGFILDIHKFE